MLPLHNACSYGHHEVADLLVKHDANVNVVDLWKFTPLHEAAAKGKYEICKLLLKVSSCATTIATCMKPTRSPSEAATSYPLEDHCHIFVTLGQVDFLKEC